MTILARDPPPNKKEDEADPTKYYLKLGGPVNWEDVYVFRYPIEAKHYIGEVEKALQTFKQFLDGNKEIAEPKISYEL